MTLPIPLPSLLSLIFSPLLTPSSIVARESVEALKFSQQVQVEPGCQTHFCASGGENNAFSRLASNVSDKLTELLD